LISCLTITQPGRLDLVGRSVRCFETQTHTDRELVLVHDGDDGFHAELEDLTAGVASPTLIVRVESGAPLGHLRNRSVDAASGEIICQWDDDDLYHPRRLELQFAALNERDAAASLLVDQLHLFEPSGDLFWDDWASEPFPMSLIQGTLMAHKSALVPYPELRRGEDTPVVMALAASGERIASLQDLGWLYVYVYDGRNAWDEQHHRDISALKARSGPLLTSALEELRGYLAEYDCPQRIVNIVDGRQRTEMTLGCG